MIRYIILTGLLLIAGLVISQNQTVKRSYTSLKTPHGDEVQLSSLGYMRIKSKDGTAKVKCTIKEITSCCIIYVKDKVLHDMMNDKVKYIEAEDTNYEIHFDENLQPFLKEVRYD
jgi:hypothetical protein